MSSIYIYIYIPVIQWFRVVCCSGLLSLVFSGIHDHLKAGVPFSQGHNSISLNSDHLNIDEVSSVVICS